MPTAIIPPTRWVLLLLVVLIRTSKIARVKQKRVSMIHVLNKALRLQRQHSGMPGIATVVIVRYLDMMWYVARKSYTLVV